MKLLVVEASPEARSRVVQVLTELDGIVVQGAVAGVDDAVRAIEACPLDGVVTGVEFPDGDVALLLAAARRRALGAVVVFAAQASEPLRARCLAAGASHVVGGRLDELAATLIRMTSRREPNPFALVGRIAVGVAHDINNYLAAAEVSLVFAERAADGDLQGDLRQVRSSFDGIARLARSLTSYARGGGPSAEPLELEPLVRGVLDAFRRIVPDGVRVILESGDRLPPVRGIGPELEQLVLNLVLNACDAMAWGGTLWLVIERAGAGRLRLEVSDTGRGLPPEVIASDGATTPSSKPARTGLGLGIVRAVVDRHGGTLELGRSSGGGSRIVVTLPTA